MNKKNIRSCMVGAYDFLNLLVGFVVLVPFVIVFPVISAAGAIIGLRSASSFDTATFQQGRRLTGTISPSENEIGRKILEEK